VSKDAYHYAVAETQKTAKKVEEKFTAKMEEAGVCISLLDIIQSNIFHGLLLIKCFKTGISRMLHAFTVSERKTNIDSLFYRAMHFSAKRGIAIACRLSVRLSVRPSVCL